MATATAGAHKQPAPEAGTAHCPAGQSENSRFRTPLRAVRKLLFSSLRQCSAVRKQCTGDIQPDQMSQARVTLRVKKESGAGKVVRSELTKERLRQPSLPRCN